MAVLWCGIYGTNRSRSTRIVSVIYRRKLQDKRVWLTWFIFRARCTWIGCTCLWAYQDHEACTWNVKLQRFHDEREHTQKSEYPQQRKMIWYAMLMIMIYSLHIRSRVQCSCQITKTGSLLQGVMMGKFENGGSCFPSYDWQGWI